METVIMIRDDVGEVVVNATDVAEWQGHGFTVATPTPEPTPEPEVKAGKTAKA